MQYKTYVLGEEDAAVLKLRAAVWGADHPHTNVSFLHWLLAENPARVGSGILMMDGNYAVGFAGLLSRRVRYGDRTHLAAQCVDYMVHPELRSGAGAMRIMSHWVELAQRSGCEFGIGFPNIHSHRVVTSERLGWKDACRPMLMIRPLSSMAMPRPTLRRIPLRMQGYASGLMARLCSARSWTASHPLPAGEAFPLTQFDPAGDALWREALNPRGAGLCRDSTYLNWRYVRHCVYSYERIGWRADGKLLGVAVASAREVFGVPCLLLVDLAASSASPRVAQALLDETARRGRELGSHLMLAMAIKASPAGDTLQRAGFIPVPNRFNPKPCVMTVHQLGSGLDLPKMLADWHFTWGDTDVV